jgi:hypothetical protein
LLAYAKKYFARVDALKGDTIITGWFIYPPVNGG